MRHRAFTLIELLVVIAVIAVLIGVLLPALGQSRKTSRMLLCTANMKNLVAGWQMYADSYKEALVAHRAPSLGGGFTNPANWHEVGNGLKFRPTWIARIGGFVGIYAFATPATDNDRQDFESKVYICPMASERTDERNGCYGYNYQFLGSSRVTNGQWHNFPVRLSKISQPSRLVVAGDASGSSADFLPERRLPYENDGRSEAAVGNEAYTIDPPRLNPAGDIGTTPYRSSMEGRHNGKAAAMFGDGHADVRTPAEFGYRFAADGRVARFGAGDQLGSAGDGVDPRNDLFSGSAMDELPPALPR